mmetsp:Transcript_54232/g.132573  ORF Transcript_54232/g.132573 Transcript_54232/m.132573 type:complete len:328 (+) Transcript_54232:49-1032(+)
MPWHREGHSPTHADVASYEPTHTASPSRFLIKPRNDEDVLKTHTFEHTSAAQARTPSRPPPERGPQLYRHVRCRWPRISQRTQPAPVIKPRNLTHQDAHLGALLLREATALRVRARRRPLMNQRTPRQHTHAHLVVVLLHIVVVPASVLVVVLLNLLCELMYSRGLLLVLNALRLKNLERRLRALVRGRPLLLRVVDEGKKVPRLKVLVIYGEETLPKLLRLVELLQLDQELHNVYARVEGWLVKLIKLVTERQGFIRTLLGIRLVALAQPQASRLRPHLGVLRGGSLPCRHVLLALPLRTLLIAQIRHVDLCQRDVGVGHAQPHLG